MNCGRIRPAGVDGNRKALRSRLRCVDITGNLARVSRHNRMPGYIPGDNCTCPDHGPLANRHSGEDRSVCTDRCAFLDVSPEYGGLVDAALWEMIVREGGVRSDENVILQRDSVPKLNAALDGHTISDHHVVLNKSVIADIAIGSDSGSWENMRKCPNTRAFADSRTFHDGSLVLEELISSVDRGIHASNRPCRQRTIIQRSGLFTCYRHLREP